MTSSPPRATQKELLLGFYDAETSLDAEVEEARFDQAIALLAAHVEGESLAPSDYRAVLKFLVQAGAAITMRMQGLRPTPESLRRQRLAFSLMAERVHALDTEGAAWYLMLRDSGTTAKLTGSQLVDAVAVEVRQGLVKAALQRWQACGGTNQLNVEERRRLACLLAEGYLASGAFQAVAGLKEEMQLAAATDGATSAHGVRLAWLEVMANCLLTREPEELIKACRRGGDFYLPICEIEAYVLLLALGRPELCERLSTPTNILRRASDSEKANPRFSKLLDFARKLSPLMAIKSGQELPMADLIALARFGADTAELHSLFQEMIALVAMNRVLTRVLLNGAADLARARYQGLSWQVSHGVLADVLSLLPESAPFAAPLLSAVTYQTAVAQGLSRQMTLVGTSVKIASVVLADRLRHFVRMQHHSQTSRDAVLASCAEIIAKDLTKLRGGLQKLVQLGVGFEAVVPESVRKSLNEVTTKGFPIRPAELQEILSSQLGRPISEVLQALDETPLASGSIAQVHRATGKDGRDLVVKVRIPKIESMIASDFKGLARLTWFLSGVLPISSDDLRAIFDHWEELALNECNFDVERENMRRVGKLFVGESGIRIPVVADGIQANAVLASDFAPGLNLDDFLKNSTEAGRQRAGVNMVRFVLRCLRHGFLKYDLDPSNFRFSEDELWVIDFGGVAEYAWTSPQNLLQVILSLQAGREDVLRMHIAGLVVKPETYDFAKDLDANRKLLLKPFLTDAPFRFTTEYARQVFYGMSADHPNLNSITMKPWWLPQSRIYWTLYSVLGRLQAEANWFQIAAEEGKEDLQAVA